MNLCTVCLMREMGLADTVRGLRCKTIVATGPGSVYGAFVVDVFAGMIVGCGFAVSSKVC